MTSYQTSTQTNPSVEALLAASVCALLVANCSSRLDDAVTDARGAPGGDAASDASAVASEPAVPAEVDAAAVAPDVPDLGAVFSVESYRAFLCDIYTRCSPALRAAYGSKEQCLSYTARIYEAVPFALPTFVEPSWDLECLADLPRLDCPAGGSSDVLSLMQYVAAALFACARPELTGCNDTHDCLGLGECSATDGSCGTCQRSATGGCLQTLDCAGGEHCIDGVCLPAKPAGSACSDFPNECASERCTDGICAVLQPQGAACALTADCEPNLWCDQGTCSPPAAPGEPCSAVDSDFIASCQYGYICHEGQCRELQFHDVAVGEPCVLRGSCVAGADCVDSVCVATDVACVDDGQCGDGQYCDVECLPKVSNGTACDSRRACSSDYCSDDHICADGNPCD